MLFVWSASVLVTGTAASLVSFNPGLRPVLLAMPWASVWPFDPSVFDSEQFAVSIPLASRALSAAAWLALLAVLAWRRRRVQPFPPLADGGPATEP